MTPEPDLVCIMIEVKKPDVQKTDGNRDKELGHLVAMFDVQAGRRVFTGTLNSIKRTIPISLEVSESGWNIVQRFNTDIYDTLEYI